MSNTYDIHDSTLPVYGIRSFQTYSPQIQYKYRRGNYIYILYWGETHAVATLTGVEDIHPLLLRNSTEFIYVRL